MSGNAVKNEPLLLERRAFLKMGAGMGLLLMGWANPVRAAMLAQDKPSSTVSLRGSARNCLLIALRGGPSHVDTFDVKTGSWTPKSFNVEKLPTGYSWPLGLMPKLAQHTDKFSIIRSLQHQEVVHERAQYFLETGRRLNLGLRSEIPHIAAVVALENEARKSSSDVFPASMLFSFGTYTNNGFLSADYAPFMVTRPYEGIADLISLDGIEAFDRRRAALKMINEINNPQTDASRQPFPVFQDQAEKMMKDPATSSVFKITNADLSLYGENYFGASLAVARNVLKSNRGTRFIEVDQYGWDNHNDIYSDDPYSLPALSKQLDQGLSALLDDLSNTAGAEAGKSLLDETFVAVLGEFGRTVGTLNNAKGRDHYPYIFSGLFAGGGVKGGRVIGSTDNIGAGAVDFGWERFRPIHLPDLVTTVYSTLSIDWTKTITNTPSGRIYRYVDPEAVGDEDSFEIAQLF